MISRECLAARPSKTLVAVGNTKSQIGPGTLLLKVVVCEFIDVIRCRKLRNDELVCFLVP